MVFSTNQVRHLYVVTKVQGTTALTDGVVALSDNAGTVALKKGNEGKNIYFQYKSADKDSILRSDLIGIDTILYAKAVDANDDTQKYTLKQAVVKLDGNINGGQPIGGQDYILRICINPYAGMSDEEPYFKYGSVYATRDMKPADFYTKMAASLYKNFSKELGKMLEFIIAGKTVGRVKTDVNGNEVLIDTTGSVITVADEYVDGITIKEVEQEWTRGIKSQDVVNFTVIPTNIVFSGDEVKWGTVTVSNSTTTVNNGKKVADLEYFCMGERGDQYRKMGWPNSIETTYLANPDTPYHIFEVHYAYVGSNEGPQKSEKDITIACADKAQLNKLIGQFNAATGSNVSTL